MWSRITYTLRETWASFKRNVTLTVAAIITSAVALLIFGLTLLMQQGFDNLLALWEDDVEMVVYVRAQASEPQREVLEGEMERQQGITIDSWAYCDVDCSLDVKDRVLAGSPEIRDRLDENTNPTFYRVVPTEGTDLAELQSLAAALVGVPSVISVNLAEDEIDLIDRLKDFVGQYTFFLSLFLLFAAVLLIWNTIRTAMYARRREIEVMKAVGATDWFIRLPFMLEGLVQGMLGGLVACGALWFINGRWTNGVAEFPISSSFQAMVVGGGDVVTTCGILMGIGALVGAIGSGIAVS
ncbi:MAG: ABC transporter permease, partial [Acidimicrobiia bacterium]|nr:ABC transporter permease [Acidimicrobiia bacterium]